MDINVNDLKELRERTGAGIMDCKKALEANSGDIEKSAQWLREKGIAKAVKKAGRISAEGLFNVIVNGNSALLYEVNCETDFVAENQKFKDFVALVGDLLVKGGAKCTDCAMEVKNEKGETMEQVLLGFTAVVGEKITLRNVMSIEKTDAQCFGVYKHNGGKIAVVDILEGGDSQIAKNIAMHICANNPQYQDESSVDPEYLKSEREVLTKEAKLENPSKPDAIIAKMIEGRLAKELKEICLVDQPFLMDNNVTVGKYLADSNAKLISYKRVVVGEGIEKKENDFVKEVMDQMSQQK